MMQSDSDVGKVAKGAPIVICRSSLNLPFLSCVSVLRPSPHLPGRFLVARVVEAFVEDLLRQTIAFAPGQQNLTAGHLCVAALALPLRRKILPSTFPCSTSRSRFNQPCFRAPFRCRKAVIQDDNVFDFMRPAVAGYSDVPPPQATYVNATTRISEMRMTTHIFHTKFPFPLFLSP
jgi:hypothetical protein